jgi:hypothetical protein
VNSAAYTLCLLACLVPVSSSGAAEEDARTSIRLSAADGEHLRRGMRNYLESVEGVVQALSANDMAGVALAAGKSGARLMAGASLTAVIGLPPQFALMSAATHQRFDDLAEAARNGASRSTALERLGEILASCTSCHAMYRISVE